ncbi:MULTISPECIES: hypothetical protein [unclassified Neorhizobium]|uniref:hypothetical protein n=1 Tax=unclassified Neorhizobium TaxID=2629175 RepID=UPI001FF13377|nr:MULTISPECIES: hypothetical protein [unclassified Neorhizobium]MCJ9674482.1 hypothetical protein [Neorhizobium sp. SHOUNA12B]MCJ9746474.1 hypothetical protein [Neorhizobium sp. SHOUNA12A]
MPFSIKKEDCAEGPLTLPSPPERVGEKASVENRLAEACAMANTLGPSNPDFDQKAFLDELWDDL